MIVRSVGTDLDELNKNTTTKQDKRHPWTDRTIQLDTEAARMHAPVSWNEIWQETMMRHRAGGRVTTIQCALRKRRKPVMFLVEAALPCETIYFRLDYDTVFRLVGKATSMPLRTGDSSAGDRKKKVHSAHANES